MTSRKKPAAIPLFLLFILFLLAVWIVWLAVPFLAAESFGSASDSLTATQKWTYSLQVLINKEKLLNPVSGQEIAINFDIEPGATVTNVANNLENKGLISSGAAFRAYIIYKGLDTQIKAGTFSLSPALSPIDIARLIQSSSSPVVSFYIYPGWRAEEIAAALPTSGIEVSPEEFLSIVKNPSGLALPPELGNPVSLEGFLFPGSYTIDRSVRADQLVMVFVQRFMNEVTPEVRMKLEQNGLSLHESIVLASIVQRETFDDAERPLIASVFYNRLAEGIMLETDPTVQYALGYSDEWGGWWKTPLSLNDLEIQSEFNTYVIPGLPDYPISNPALPSLLAVAEPAKAPYYFFRAKCDGSGTHVFSITFEEHLSNGCK
jgi:UPF0755 protein